MGIDETEFLARLLDLCEVAIDAPSLEAMVQALVDSMAGLMEADGCFITFWDEERRSTVPAAAFGPMRDRYRSIVFPPDERTLTETIAMSGGSVIVEDALHSGSMNPRIAQALSLRAFLGLPMISDSRVLGAIIIGFAETRGFSAEDIARAERAGRHASFAVAKMLLLEEERRRSEELEVLNRIGLAINADRDLEHLARTIFEQCRRVIRLDTFYLALYDEAREELAFPLFYDGGETVAMEPRSIRDRPGMSGYIIRARASLSIPDASLPEVQERYDVVRSGGIPSRAYIGVPLIYGDKVLGVLSVQNRNANEYAAHHVRLVETIAAQSAIAIENARLYGELQEMSITDGLTGAFNFRHLMELGPLEFAKASRLGRPLALLFLDIDRFHDFNARYGHATGNEVLKAVVNRARGCVRGIDIFARYGGEEFVIVLPEIPPAEAAVIAERVRSSIEALRVPAAPDGTTEAPEEGLSVTISVGLASATPELKDFEALVAAANAAERLAKERGRNRVEKAG